MTGSLFLTTRYPDRIDKDNVAKGLEVFKRTNQMHATDKMIVF